MLQSHGLETGSMFDVEKFGPNENGEECVASVQEGFTYLFFLSTIGDQLAPSDQGPLLFNKALPLEVDLDILRRVSY